jgi:hypothetical protein
LSEAELSPCVRRVLAGLAGFEPAWVLSGRAALFRFSGVPSPITRLDLVWHARELLGSLPWEIRQALLEVGLTATILESGTRVAWLRVSDTEDDCLLKLVAEPTPPLEAPWRATLAGIPIEVENPRDVLAATACALEIQPDPWACEDLLVLFQNRNRTEFERGLKVDAPLRDPEFCTLRLIGNVAALSRLEEMDERRAPMEELIRYILEKIDYELRSTEAM